MKIKCSIYTTIGYNQNFKNALSYKIGQRKMAIRELTNYFNNFDKFYNLSLGLLSENEYNSFLERFRQQAEQKAIEFIKEVESSECFINNRFFAYLP